MDSFLYTIVLQDDVVVVPLLEMAEPGTLSIISDESETSTLTISSDTDTTTLSSTTDSILTDDSSTTNFRNRVRDRTIL